MKVYAKIVRQNLEDRNKRYGKSDGCCMTNYVQVDAILGETAAKKEKQSELTVVIVDLDLNFRN